MSSRVRFAAVLLLAAGFIFEPAQPQSRLPQKSNVILEAPTEPGVAVDAKQYPRFADLRAACIAVAPKACVVTVSSAMPLDFAGTAYVPANMQVHFAPGGQWQLAGDALDFSGGRIDAPVDQQVFTGPGKVRGLNEARPEWFVGETSGGIVPATGLAAAYNATVTQGTIRLGARPYVSPFVALPQSISPQGAAFTQVLYSSPRTFLGAGRPLPNSDTAPTHLIGGTIVLGQVVGSAPVVVEHLGIDDGPLVSATYFGGFKGHGLALFGTGKLEGTGTRIEDVSVLTEAGDSTHSVMVEGQSFATIQGLWIWTLGGLHGLVLKSSHSSVNDFHCKGASDDCLIVKSDYVTSRAGDAHDDTLSGIYISYLQKPGDTGGIVIDSTWGSVHDVTLSDVHLSGLSYGMSAGGSLFFTLRNLRLEHWTAQELTGSCVELGHYRGVDISNFDCSLAPVKVPQAILLDGRDTHLANIDVSCGGSPAACAAAGSAGISLLGGTVSLAHIHGSLLGGALVASTSPLRAEQLAQLSATGMSGPLAAAYVAPHRSMGARLRTIKPPLRIAYEYTRTRVREHPLPALIALLLLTGLASMVLRRRRQV